MDSETTFARGVRNCVRDEGLIACLLRPTVGKKLAVAFALFLSLTWATAMLIEGFYDGVVSSNRLINESGRLRYLSQEIAYKATRLAWSPTPEQAATLPSLIGSYEDILAGVEDAARTLPWPMEDTSDVVARQLSDLRNCWLQYRLAVQALARADSNAAAFGALKEVDARAGSMLAIADQVVGELTLATDRAHAAIDRLILGIVLFDMAFLVLIYWWVRSRISTPVKEIARMVRRFAAGDREHRYHYWERDEIGALACDVNRTADEMERLIQQRDQQIQDQARLTDILESTTDLVATVDPDGRLTWLNQAGHAVLAVDLEADVQAYTITEILAASCRQNFLENGLPAILRDGVWSDEAALVATNGHEIPVSLVGLAHRTRQGEMAYISLIGRDISERKHAEEMLRLLKQGIESAVNAIVITDATVPGNPVLYANPAFERITGYRPEEVLGRGMSFLRGGDDDQPQLGEIRLALKHQREGRALLRNYRKDGSLFWNELYIAPVKGNGQISHFVGVLNDVTEAKRYESELERQATYDGVTGLPNRNLLHDRIGQGIAHAQRHDHALAVLFLDLDRFNLVNESYGHAFGDLLLKAVAERLVICVRKEDTVGRQGGDEFVIVLSDLGREEEAALVAEKIIDAFAAPLHLEGRELFISASIGIAIYPRDGRDTEGLLRAADTALYRAKDQGRNTYCFFAAEMNASVLGRIELERDLRHALERNEFVLHYQPQYGLADGRVIGVEALVRWQHPQHGLVSPARFIPIAEETGLIEEIGLWVMRQACSQMQDWRKAGVDVPRVAINLSARQFHRCHLIDQVAAILDLTGLPPDCLELEITESMLMHDAEAAAEMLKELKRLGVHLSVDDFGTGYSSLAYLKRFPIDRLKIDRSFICNLPEDQEDAALVRAIVSLAGSLALDVIAEGVETAEQRDFLRSRGCNMAQGYLFAAPMAATDLAGLLNRS